MREFVVEADGGSRGNPGPAGYGAVVLDAATGQTLVETAEYLGVVTNNVAEYRGLLAGLRAAHALDPSATVRVRMDSKLVVEQMSGRWKIKHPDMKPLAAEAGRVFPPGRVTYEWIPRADNKHADRLANEAMDAGSRGEQWSPSLSTAELDAASRSAGGAGTRRSGDTAPTTPATAEVAEPATGAAAPGAGGVEPKGGVAVSVGGARAAGRGAGTAEPYAEGAEPATAAAAPGAGGVEPKGGVAVSVGGARAAGRGAGTAEPYAEVAEPATAAAAPGAGGVEPKGGVAVSVGGARAAGRGAGTAEPYAEVAEPATGAAAPYAAGVKPKGAAVASVGGAGGAGRGAGAAEREAEAAVPRPGAAVPDVGAGETGARAAKPAGEAVASVGDLEAVGEGATTPAARAGTAPATTPAARAGTAPATTPAARAGADVRAAKAVAAPGWGPPDLGAPATFVLLRHGETPLTPQKRFSGSGGSDPALSAVGREQAEKVAASLARRGTVQAIVSSPLARTRETAAVVAARLGLEVTVDEGLRETDFGAWEGLTFGEVRERYPDDLNAWLGSPDAEPTGGGESFAATGARIAATRDKLVAAYAGRTVLLVSHVTPIKTFVQLALGAPPESLFRMELSAASLSAVAYYADGGASVRLFNDTSHLR